MSNQSQHQAQLVDLRTVIRLGEETVSQMGDYDMIELMDGRIVDRADIESETQRVMDALARMDFEQKIAQKGI